MSFNSPIFLFCFLPVVFLAYRFGNNNKYRNILLAAASLVFYAFGQIWYVFLLVGSVCINYVSGLALMKKKSRFTLALSIALNLIILCIFKYSAELKISGLALPLGISFFTFQGMSYVIDTYRDGQYGTRNFLKLLLYVCFFPRLVAGPIVKYHEIEDSLMDRTYSDDAAADGLRRFVTGFGKKMLIAEPMAHVTDTVMKQFSSAEVGDFRLCWIVALAYMLQIYFDFSGYSDMAIGLGRIFGFDFPENFNHPYGAYSIKEFWRKWHITLSSWFKEYVYIPLGGNRKGKLRATLNRLIVFLLTGVWHGANLTYVFWGVCHGLLSSAEDMDIIPVKKLEKNRAGRLALKIYTLAAVCLLFVIFRSENLMQGFSIIAGMFSSPALKSNNFLIYSLITPAFLFAFVFGVLLSGRLPEKVKISSTVLRDAGLLTIFVLGILAMARGNATPFIYAQF